MADWGVPDWTNADAYPVAADTSPRVWWWEFTRRRPDYREMWTTAPQVPEWDYRFAPDVDAFRLQFQLSVIHDPTRSFSDWELMQMRYPVNGGFAPRVRKGGFPDDLVDHQAELATAHGVYNFAFDLSRPLPAQLSKAKRLLEDIQAERFPDSGPRRPRMANWPTFLRCLDARDDGVTYEAIARAIWPGQEKTPQSARDTYSAACELRDKFPL